MVLPAEVKTLGAIRWSLKYPLAESWGQKGARASRRIESIVRASASAALTRRFFSRARSTACSIVKAPSTRGSGCAATAVASSASPPATDAMWHTRRGVSRISIAVAAMWSLLFLLSRRCGLGGRFPALHARHPWHVRHRRWGTRFVRRRTRFARRRGRSTRHVADTSARIEAFVAADDDPLLAARESLGDLHALGTFEPGDHRLGLGATVLH